MKPKYRRFPQLLAMVLFPLLLSGLARAGNYTVTDLGAASHAYGVNEHGDAVGDAYTNAFHAFEYSNGTSTALGTLGGSNSLAWAVNSDGYVVGYSDTAGGAHHAFIYNNTMSDLGTLGGANSYAYGISEDGQVAGAADVPGNGAYHAFRYREGVMTDIGTLGGTYSVAFGINNNGQLVGSAQTVDGYYHAFLYDGGAMADLGLLGGSSSWAAGINDNGELVGWTTDSVNTDHAFLYSNGVTTDLSALAGPYSRALGINNHGQVVGVSLLGAFLYSDGRMQFLDSLVAADSGWTSFEAFDINDQGQIVGSATFGGQTHAFLMTPVPEPRAVWLFGFGLTAIAIVSRRRKAA